jgi:hypothetical protein
LEEVEPRAEITMIQAAVMNTGRGARWIQNRFGFNFSTAITGNKK